MDPLLAAKFC